MGVTAGAGSIDPSFWSGRRVFVTGHTGFKGSWLSSWLIQLGADVFGYALPPVDDVNLFDLIELASRLEHRTGDVRDLDALEAAIHAARPEIIFHLAAQPLVRESYRDPVGTYATNVMGTVNVLEAARRSPEARVTLVVTSDKCYENREWPWGYREVDTLGGHDPYSSSKACAEMVTAAYRSSYFDGSANGERVIASVRAGNVIGGGDWSAERLVPDAIRAFSTAQPVQLRNPAATRPWQHVLEPLRAYLLLCQHAYLRPESASQAFNLGPDEDDVVTVSALIQLVSAAWGPDARWSTTADADLHEARELKLDSSRARTILGWRPSIKLREAVDMTVAFYRQVHGGASSAQLRAILDEQLERASGSP